MLPLRYDPDNVPVFTSDQVDDYGFPEFWGFDVYRIVENRECMKMTTDYKMEQSYYKRPIHRYSRKTRFMTVLHHLLGDKGRVPDFVIAIIQTYMKPGDEWNQVRRMLKHYKLSMYYNRIPYIIQQITKTNSASPVSADQYQGIVADFDRFLYWFEQHKHQFERTYFPNMRFIALKLIQLHGVELNYPIPLVRTQRKLKQLEQLWDLFNKTMEVYR